MLSDIVGFELVDIVIEHYHFVLKVETVNGLGLNGAHDLVQVQNHGQLLALWQGPLELFA